MARIPLDVVRAHVHLTAMNSTPDSLLSLYTDAAEEFAEKYCRKTFGFELPASVKAACLLWVGALVETKEAVVTGTIVQDNPAVKALLDVHRDLKDYFGPAVDPAILIETDSEAAFVGDDWSRVWRLTDESSPVNITDYTGDFFLYSGQSVIHTGALVIDNAADGRFSYAIPDAVTAALAPEAYWYKARAESPAGEVITLDRRQIVFV